MSNVANFLQARFLDNGRLISWVHLFFFIWTFLVKYLQNRWVLLSVLSSTMLVLISIGWVCGKKHIGHLPIAHRCCARDVHLFSVNPFLYTPLCSSADFLAPSWALHAVFWIYPTTSCYIRTSTGLCFHLFSFAVGSYHNLRGPLKYLLLLWLGTSVRLAQPLWPGPLLPLSLCHTLLLRAASFSACATLLLLLSLPGNSLSSTRSLLGVKEYASEHFLSNGEMPSHVTHILRVAQHPTCHCLKQERAVPSVLLFSPLKSLEQGLGLCPASDSLNNICCEVDSLTCSDEWQVNEWTNERQT